MTNKDILTAFKQGKITKDQLKKMLALTDVKTTQSPLSEVQRGFWMLQKMSPGMNAYNLPFCVRIKEKVDTALFEEACGWLLKKYPVLSTLIKEEREIPYQIYRGDAVIPLVKLDISHLKEEEIVGYIKKLKNEPFTLDKELCRFYLLSYSEQEYLFLLNVHHLLFDGSSILPILQALFTCYQHLLEGKFPDFGDYSDYHTFVAWEQEMLGSKEGEKQLAYWKKQLAGPLPVLELPLDHPRPAGQSYRGTCYSKVLSQTVSGRIKSYSQSENINISVFFLGVFKLLLNRYSRQNDIIVGMPVRNRAREEFDTMAGLLVNMIALRSRDFEKNTFRDFLKNLQDTLLDGLDYADFPFPKIVRELAIDRSSGNSPVYQAIFEFQNFLRPGSLKDVRGDFCFEFVPGIGQEGECEYGLEVVEQEEGFLLNLKYNPDLFDRVTIERMVEHFLEAVDQVLENPGKKLAEYVILTENEEKTVVFDWNNTNSDYPEDKCLHHLFEQQARNTPDSIAVVYENTSLTYRELNEKSGQVALYLQQQGVKPDNLIGVFFNRSVEMMIGILGIIKAGGAYVPLDPTYPADRLKYMISDSAVPLIISHTALEKDVEALVTDDLELLYLDKDWAKIENISSAGKTLQETVKPANLVYTIYTSGSTGKPKGVMITHNCLTNLLTSMTKKPGITGNDVMLSLAPYGFDMVIPELYLPLINGARCCLCDSEKSKDAEKLKREISRIKPTIMQATPATCTMLFRAGWKNSEGVKILCGAEALTEPLKKLFVENNCEVWNMYGPTETTVWSSTIQVKEHEPITIGTPLANTQMYIVDQNLRPAPIGIIGELCIGGEGVARGYLHKPELTAEKFVDNPFNRGKKLYRTGDLARWLSNGRIEYLGRSDFQIKLRGYRIELGEIENQLAGYPGIATAVVVVKKQNDNKVLVAYYVVEHAGEQIQSADLRSHLQKSLPQYMVPAFFVGLDVLPLTPNGKVNRMDLMGRSIQASHPGTVKAPKSKSENRLLKIWQESLGVDDISTEQGFFEIGGDSVLAVTVASRIQREFGCDFNVTQLFKYATIVEISEYLNRLLADSQAESAGTADAEQTEIAIGEQKGSGESLPGYLENSIAIIGISCQFPGAKNWREFWHNLLEGKESTRFFTKQELEDLKIPGRITGNPRYIPVNANLEDKYAFDPFFFNISQKDAEIMDPQARLLLMHSWKAIEDAGYQPAKIADTGVFMSASNNFYLAQSPDFTQTTQGVLEDSNRYVSWILGQGGTIPTMISYKLGLKGPSYFVHSNCSSSLVGLYNAFHSIRTGEVQYSLVGGSTVFPYTNPGYIHHEGMNFSSDGHVKAFDAQADGMVGGDGAAVLLLKNAKAAVEDKDTIYALIRGAGINNDGSDKVGFYAPSVKGQSEVILKVLKSANIHPETISYIEAHGTGTKLGDPIEVAALQDVFRTYTDKKQFCGIGSVKTNIGHMDTAAGLAGCIKAALSLYHGKVPKSLNYKKPNPNLNLQSSPFYVVNRNTDLKKQTDPHRAAVSSLGVGGTNAHVILEQLSGKDNGPDVTAKDSPPKSPFLIPLSAKKQERLYCYAKELHRFLSDYPDYENKTANIAYTLQTGRQAMDYRVIFVVDDLTELLEKLQRFIEQDTRIPGCFQGGTKSPKDNPGTSFRYDDLKDKLMEYMNHEDMSRIAELWSSGQTIAWETFYTNDHPCRLSLPTYPFEQEQYRVSDLASHNQASQLISGQPDFLHPLLHKNTSDLAEQKYSSIFTGDEPFFERQHVKGAASLSALAYLEMAIEGMFQAHNKKPRSISLKNIRWAKPFSVTPEKTELHIVLLPRTVQTTDFEIYSGTDEQIIHCQGRASVLEHQPDTSLFDIQKHTSELIKTEGKHYPGIVSVFTGPAQKLVQLDFPHTRSKSVLFQPALLEKLLDICRPSEEDLLQFPAALSEFGLHRAGVHPEWVHILQNGGQNSHYDCNFYDGQGKLIIHLKGLVSKKVESLQPGIFSTPKHTSPGHNREGDSLKRDILHRKTGTNLKKLFGDLVKLPVHRIDGQELLEKYGIDSIVITQLNEKLAAVFGTISKTLFYEYQTLDALTGYLVEAHQEGCQKWAGIITTEEEISQSAETQEPVFIDDFPRLDSLRGANHKRYRFSNNDGPSLPLDEPIAIIGLAGRYPGAKNLQEFWQNLRAGKNSISEIPADRWSLKDFFEPDVEKAITNGKSYSKWGGFLEGFADFDPLFFNISPLEAMNVDPQERLFLESCWQVFEDAGYTKAQLSSRFQGRIGVFAGINQIGHNLYGPDFWRAGKKAYPYTSFSSIANRVSYVLDLHGPCMPIDTMCSSSLTAIHEACEHLKRNECDMAVAGGVNLYLHPSNYIILCNRRMLSSDGQCKSFGKGGNGYVPGEGVGTVLLKPLSKAVKDGDNIYALIRGSGINHGGKTNGYSVPNPVAQAQVIRSALEKANISARQISYLEAHGTGTSLGDPIEITGLTRAFRKETDDNGFCAIGSVKSNIGHLEAAAGIAGLTKILLQLKNHELVPSLHSKEINPNIDFQHTPFVIQQGLNQWQKPPCRENDQTKQYARLAGLSSFGAGGSNAHIIIEEYIDQTKDISPITFSGQKPAIIVLSAKSGQQLQEKARQLIEAIHEKKFRDSDLADIAYTLQVGRQAMDERLAVLTDSVHDLTEKLERFVNEKEVGPDMVLGEVREEKNTLHLFNEDEELRKAIDTWISKGKYGNIIEFWVKGLAVDWNKLYGEGKPKKISLPTYPFAREKFWVVEADFPGDMTLTSTPVKKTIHPLLHENTSDFMQQRYSCLFDGKEFFLRDHLVNGKSVLPGVAYLEMARLAIGQSLGDRLDDNLSISLLNVVWVQPVIVDNTSFRVHIGLVPMEDNSISFEVYSENNETGEKTVHCQGQAILAEHLGRPSIDLFKLQEECPDKNIDIQECYRLYKQMGLDYGPAHQGVNCIRPGQNKVLAKVILPDADDVKESFHQFELHPSLLDSALQTAIGLTIESVNQKGGPDVLQPILPFALEKLDIYAPCTSEMWVYLRHADNSGQSRLLQKLDIDLYNSEGEICISLQGFTSRIYSDKPDYTANPGTLILQPQWLEAHPVPGSSLPEFDTHLVFLCELPDDMVGEIKNQIKGCQCLHLALQDESPDLQYITAAGRLFSEIKKVFSSQSGQKILIQLAVPAGSLFIGLGAMLKTAARENPQLSFQIIEIDDTQKLVKRLKENYQGFSSIHTGYRENQQYIFSWQDSRINSAQIPWKEKGVYLITGGTGGLGKIITRDILEKTDEVTLILTGRSELSPDKQSWIETARGSGATIEYRQVDVTSAAQVARLIEDIKQNHPGLKGIFHCAGVIDDEYILKKDISEVQTVLAPKVTGLVNLDSNTHDMEMDFFVLFSSISAANGNAGQSDYATANAFMDQFAVNRNKLVSEKKRSGKTISINWPLWQDGGMKIDEAVERALWQEAGLVPLPGDQGILALYKILSAGNSLNLVLCGDEERIRSILESTVKKMQAPEIEEESKNITLSAGSLTEQTGLYLKKQVSSIIQLPVERIGDTTAFADFGIDSVMVMELTNQLEKSFGSLSKTLFFEYQNIAELCAYFIKNYQEKLQQILGMEQTEAALPLDETGKSSAGEKNVQTGLTLSSRFKSVVPSPQQIQKDEGLAIAIIGMSGKYPEAANLQEYWENLRDGRDCIGEVPKQRWDHTIYFDPDKNKPGKTYTKWGGFLKDVDLFDPLFFNISPAEAEIMDPQERLFLQCAYETLEDAGYTREGLSQYQASGLTGNVGVYVGVMYEEYQLYGAQATVLGKPFAIGGNPSSIANRVSYFCNFHGPSIAVDTLCSSSLTTIHLACQSIQQGECELALAGGVNVSVHPNKYLLLAQGKFASSNGRCESFGKGGDGYVPGEGVGALLLKPLSKAITDNDHIYGVIKGTAINHGGKTNGYTVPNPNAQSQVITRAIKQSGLNPRAISYIEAHGTGTSLGDPIEMTGLTKAFREYTSDNRFCAIGSAKSNIGHCESAAGIAGITKVLLQMKHKKLVSSLHSETLNPYIDFTNTPFVVQQELGEWKRPVLEEKGVKKEYPRIAGISSFGAGGANAHILIQEYVMPEEDGMPVEKNIMSPVVIVLSAKNKDRLKKQAGNLLKAIQFESYSDKDLVSLAYTLQVGRDTMEERLALVAESVEDLQNKLGLFIGDEILPDTLFLGHVKKNQAALLDVNSDKELGKEIENWINQKNFSRIIELWVKGLIFDWKRLYGEKKPRLLSLPSYPFAQNRYWIDLSEITKRPAGTESQNRRLHQLVHENTSNIHGLRFSSTFTGDEFFLKDHVVGGQHVLPGVAYFEMAQTALKYTLQDTAESGQNFELKNIVWLRPIVVADNPVTVHISLFPEEKGKFSFEIYSDADKGADSIVHCQGRAIPGKKTDPDPPAIDNARFNDSDLFTGKKIEKDECYAVLDKIGLSYGPAHQCIQELYIKENEVSAKLELPAFLSGTKEQYHYHPALMDCALQASFGMMLDKKVTSPFLPFAVDSVEIASKCPSKIMVWLRYSKGYSEKDTVQKLDIDLCNQEGDVYVRLKGYSSRRIQGQAPQEDTSDTVLFHPDWHAVEPDLLKIKNNFKEHVVFLCEMGDISSAEVTQRFPDSRFVELNSELHDSAERFKVYSVKLLDEMKTIINTKPKEPVLVQLVVQNDSLLYGLGGILKTASQENGKLSVQIIEMENEKNMLEKLSLLK